MFSFSSEDGDRAPKTPQRWRKPVIPPPSVSFTAGSAATAAAAGGCSAGSSSSRLHQESVDGLIIFTCQDHDGSWQKEIDFRYLRMSDNLLH